MYEIIFVRLYVPNYLTRLPSLMRPQPLAMPFGDDGMASTTVVSVKRKWHRGGGWSMGPRGSNCTKGVDSGQWATAGESIGFRRGGGGGGKSMVGSLLLSSTCFCGEPAEGIIWRGKSYFPPKVGNIPGEVGKNSTRKSGTIVLGTVVRESRSFSQKQ